MKCISTNIRNNTLKITFRGSLEAKNLAEGHSGILKALKKPVGKVVIGNGNYEKIDFSFIQLLLVLKKHIEQKGLDLELNLTFSDEDAGLLRKLNMMNLLQTKSENNESFSS